MSETQISFVPYAPGTTSSQGQRIASIDPRLSRTNYFDGRLLKATDLIRDQVYLDERALEIGQVLGAGIVRGLDVNLLENHRLQVTPGMAIAPSGRVLQLSNQTLEVNLGNSALITSLNQGKFRRFRRGLYLVALQYAEVGSDSAEAYPSDLASPRRFNFNSYAEGVELTLIPLAVPLSQTSEVAARAGLVAEFIGRGDQPGGQRPELSDEAVALGLLAMDSSGPIWLDKALVRRPLRQIGAADALQHNLAAHYDELLALVLDARHSGGLSGGFAAAQYFSLLPPWGRLPKACVDPVNGSQIFFPDGYEVSIAPVRRDDLAAIIAESARLSPMDLQHDKDADIMVLVPLSNSEFAWRARSLEHGLSTPKDAFGLGRLLAIDRLALRLRPLPKVHEIDTDRDAWAAIWQLASDGEILFVRRPPRTAETNVSAVVLARGFDLPKPGIDLSAYNRVMELELADKRRQIEDARQDLQFHQEDFARRLRNLKLDPEAPARELADKLKALEAERDALLKRVKELEAAGNGGVELEQARKQIDKLSAQLEAAKKQIAELQASASDTTSTELAALLERNNKLLAELEAANKKITLLQASADSGNSADLDAAKSEIDKLNKQLDIANKRITELQAAGGSGGAELDAAKARIASLTAELEGANKRITELQAAAGTGTGIDNTALDQAKAEIEKLNKQLDIANKRITELQSAGTGASAADLDAAQSRIKTLTQELETANKRITELQSAGSGASAADLDAAKARINTLTQELEAGNKRINELQAANESAKTELAASQKTSTQLSQELELSNKKIAELQAGAAQPAAAPSLPNLAKLRPATDAASRKAIDTLTASLSSRPEEAAVVADILMLVDRRYDSVIWPTLSSVAKQPGQLAKLRDFLQKNTDAARPVGPAMAAAGANFGLGADLVASWKDLG